MSDMTTPEPRTYLRIDTDDFDLVTLNYGKARSIVRLVLDKLEGSPPDICNGLEVAFDLMELAGNDLCSKTLQA